MSQPDVLSPGAFLPPAYAAQIEKMEEIGRLLEPSPDSGISVNEQLVTYMMKAAPALNRQKRFFHGEAKRLPKSPTSTSQGRERVFQLHGAMSVVLDHSLKLSTDLASIATGELEANQPESTAIGYEVGEELITLRARHTASALLRAADVIYREYDDTPNSSSWERVRAVHKSGRAKAGPKIRNRELQQFDKLCDAALEAPIEETPILPFKPSKFIVVTMFRAAVAAWSEMTSGNDTSSVLLLEKSRQLSKAAASSQPVPLELPPAQIIEVMGTITKILKHVKNAARVDSSIAADPTVRYLSFMLSRLDGGYAIGSEIAAYKRRAEQTADQLRQFHD